MGSRNQCKKTFLFRAHNAYPALDPVQTVHRDLGIVQGVSLYFYNPHAMKDV